MAKTNVAFRISEEDKAYLYDLAEKNEVTMTKFFEDVCELIKSLEYDGNSFKSKEIRTDFTPIKKQGEVDLDRLFKVAESRRETPQSVLDNALRFY